MGQTETEEISLIEINNLAKQVFSKFGCDADNANALAKTVSTAERDGSLSHGLFRVPGYVASLKSGKVKGTANPKIEQNLPSIISVDGDHGFAPYALELGLPVLAKAAEDTGIAIGEAIFRGMFTFMAASSLLLGIAIFMQKNI